MHPAARILFFNCCVGTNVVAVFVHDVYHAPATSEGVGRGKILGCCHWWIMSDASSPSSSVGAPSGGTHKPLLGGQPFWCSSAPVQIIRAVFPRMNPCDIIP
jgi:hypothetical protein